MEIDIDAVYLMIQNILTIIVLVEPVVVEGVDAGTIVMMIKADPPHLNGNTVAVDAAVEIGTGPVHLLRIATEISMKEDVTVQGLALDLVPLITEKEIALGQLHVDQIMMS